MAFPFPPPSEDLGGISGPPEPRRPPFLELMRNVVEKKFLPIEGGSSRLAPRPPRTPAGFPRLPILLRSAFALSLRNSYLCALGCTLVDRLGCAQLPVSFHQGFDGKSIGAAELGKEHRGGAGDN